MTFDSAPQVAQQALAEFTASSARAKLERTTDYALFRMYDRNRDVDFRHVKALTLLMKEHGFLPSAPLMVFRSPDGKLVVANGNHRLAAAKLAGVPVYYVVSPKEDAESVIEGANNAVRKWSLKDNVTYFAKKGVPSYAALLEYVAAGVPLYVAASLLLGWALPSSASAGRLLHDGKFRIKTRENIDHVVKAMRTLGGENAAATSHHFIRALSACLSTKGFDVEAFVRRAKDNKTLLVKTNNLEQMLTNFETIYNTRARSKWPLKFEVEKAVKERAKNRSFTAKGK